MGGMSDKERILRNLKDAGCDEETIKRFFCLRADGRRKEQYRRNIRHIRDLTHCSTIRRL